MHAKTNQYRLFVFEFSISEPVIELSVWIRMVILCNWGEGRSTRVRLRILPSYNIIYFVFISNR